VAASGPEVVRVGAAPVTKPDRAISLATAAELEVQAPVGKA